MWPEGEHVSNELCDFVGHDWVRSVGCEQCARCGERRLAPSWLPSVVHVRLDEDPEC